MQKNKILEERRKKVRPEIRQYVNKSFDVADRICEILKEQGKDQKTLALSLGKSEAEISKWMRGTHNFTLKTLAKIEVVLGEPLIEVSKKFKKEHDITPIFVTSFGKYTSEKLPISKTMNKTMYQEQSNQNRPFIYREFSSYNFKKGTIVEEPQVLYQ